MKADDYDSLTPSELAATDDDIVRGLAQGSYVGGVLADHLLRLANAAFCAGRKDCAEILERWALTPNTTKPLHMAWAAHSLSHSGFWGTLERVLLALLSTSLGRDAIYKLVAGRYISPDCHSYMLLDMSETDITDCRDILSGQRPWADPVQELEPLLRRYLESIRAKRKGGWD